MYSKQDNKDIYMKRLLIPPILIQLYRRIHINKYIHLFNSYDDWETAELEAFRIGKANAYGSSNILDKVAESIQKVRSGEACYEQDGVVFIEEKNEWELLASLYYILAREDHLSICDFGGSLGSTYFRYRNKLPLNRIKWNIVEQKNYVDYGAEHIPELKFFTSIEQCYKVNTEINVVLLLSVLQFLENPYEMLERVLRFSPRYVVIDATPFSTMNTFDTISLEHVPESVYKAVYPSWIFNRDMMISFFEGKGYKKTFEWIYPFGNLSIKTRFWLKATKGIGFLFERV